MYLHHLEVYFFLWLYCLTDNLSLEIRHQFFIIFKFTLQGNEKHELVITGWAEQEGDGEEEVKRNENEGHWYVFLEFADL